MVPVGVEHVRHLLHDGTDPHDVEIAELRVFAYAEILVRDIPAADDRNLVVDRERLVVHAAIDAPEFG